MSASRAVNVAREDPHGCFRVEGIGIGNVSVSISLSVSRWPRTQGEGVTCGTSRKPSKQAGLPRITESPRGRGVGGRGPGVTGLKREQRHRRVCPVAPRAMLRPRTRSPQPFAGHQPGPSGRTPQVCLHLSPERVRGLLVVGRPSPGGRAGRRPRVEVRTRGIGDPERPHLGFPGAARSARNLGRE